MPANSSASATAATSASASNWLALRLQIVFHTLLRRIPTLKLAIPFDEVPFKHDRLAYGVYELPVTW